MTELEQFEVFGHFEATDLDDAFERLAKHFAALASGDDARTNYLGVSNITLRRSADSEFT